MPRRRITSILFPLALLGCRDVLGIGDDPSAPAGAGGATSTSTSTGPGGPSSSGAGAGGGGQGGDGQGGDGQGGDGQGGNGQGAGPVAQALVPEWAVAIGSTGDDDLLDVALSASGQTAIAFQVTDQFTIDGITYAPNQGKPAALIVVLDKDGELDWWKFLGSITSDSATSGYTIRLAFDGEELVVVGSIPHISLLVLDQSLTLGGNGHPDVFAARYDEGGVLLDSMQFGNVDSQLAIGARLRPDGSIVVTGTYCGAPIVAGACTFPAVGCPSGDGSGLDLYVAVFGEDLECDLVWTYPASGNQIGYDVDVRDDQVVVMGLFEGSLQLGDAGVEIGGPAIGNGATDYFLATLDLTSGVGSFGRRLGPDAPLGVAFDGEDLLLSGTVQGAPPALPQPVAPRPGQLDGYAAKVRFNGTPGWASYYGGPEDDAGTVQRVGESLRFVGAFNGAATFGGIDAVADADDGADALLLDLDEEGTPTAAWVLGGPGIQAFSRGLVAGNGVEILVGHLDGELPDVEPALASQGRDVLVVRR